MKGIILGTDLLEYNDSVKILEINTNTTIDNRGVPFLDFDILFNMLNTNNITEFHFIFTDAQSFTPKTSLTFDFETKIKEMCVLNNITYFQYKVPEGSVTVPYVEDASNKFILRQAYDTTALIDEQYCADKFEFCSLMSGSTYLPKTYINGTTIQMDTLDVITEYVDNKPNLIKKHKTPDYDYHIFPKTYSILNSEMSSVKENVTESNPQLENNLLLQEFIYDEKNIVNGRYNVIRSIDIIYGGTLEVMNLGSYKTSTAIPVDFTPNTFFEGTKELDTKSRLMWTNKNTNAFEIIYHLDEESLILDGQGTFRPISTFNTGDIVSSVNFTNANGVGPSDEGYYDTLEKWTSTFDQTVNTIVNVQTEIVKSAVQDVKTLFVQITLENGIVWKDSPNSFLYIEESGSTVTSFHRTNCFYIGDKVILRNMETGELTKSAIVSLDIVYDELRIFEIDVEPSDLFLTDLNNSVMAIQHNVACDWCGWYGCGSYRCDSPSCPGCSQGIPKL